MKYFDEIFNIIFYNKTVTRINYIYKLKRTILSLNELFLSLFYSLMLTIP